MKETRGASTAAVHAGEPRRRNSLSVNEPIVTGVTFPFANTAEMMQFVEERKYEGSSERPDYGRHSNPTRLAAEKKLAALESDLSEEDHGIEAILTPSGMAALSGLLLYLLGSGDHLILSDSIYRVTKIFITTVLEGFGVEVSTVHPASVKAISSNIKPSTKAILVESPSNPFNYCMELDELARLGRDRQVITIVDSTLATPFNIRPLGLGIDFVVHSITKYLSGHNDVVAGAVVGEDWNIAAVRPLQTQMGAMADPHSCSGLLRGLKTFGLRMRQHNANGLALARMLADHEKVETVWYAGLESHPDHETAKRLMSGYGGIVSFEVQDHDQAARLNDRLRLGLIGGSLGATETMVHQPWLLSHFDQTEAERAELGIREGLIRVACGIEDTADLLYDFRQALDSL